MLRPGGAVMGFFCTSPRPSAPFTKYEIVDDKSLRHRPHAGSGGAKHVLQNRDIIKMFDGLIVVGLVPAEKQHPGDPAQAQELGVTCVPSSRS